jgi:hypothetical protein
MAHAPRACPCRYLNQKRAKLLVSAHVRGQRLPSLAAGNRAEPMLRTAGGMAPHVELGCSTARAWGVDSPAQLAPRLLADWWRLFGAQGYLLTWRDGRAYVVLKQQGVQQQQPQQQRPGGQPLQEQQALLRALWQAAWLEAHYPAAAAAQRQGGGDDPLALLQAAQDAAAVQFEGFLQEAAAAGWRPDQVVLRAGDYRLAQDGGVSGAAGAGSDSDLADLDA